MFAIDPATLAADGKQTLIWVAPKVQCCPHLNVQLVPPPQEYGRYMHYLCYVTVMASL